MGRYCRFLCALAIAWLGADTAGAHTEPWIAAPEVAPGGDGETIVGVVFEDTNGDGRRQAGEAGVAGVLVSNGLDVARTDADGAYRLAVRPDMDLFVIQPSGWRVPVDARNVPQFAYVHKPGGSRTALRYGGLADTGPAPRAVNFPLRRIEGDDGRFTCAVIGDSQPYNNAEAGQFRDSVLADLAVAGLSADDCMLYMGDVVSDDLSLLPRVFELGAAIGAPQWAIPGNHDADFDGPTDADTLDTWRRVWGPAYYAFERGEALFIGLDNVSFYPCDTAEEIHPAILERCTRGRVLYAAYLPPVQMQWLRNLLAQTPKDRLVVLAHHIPLVNTGATRASFTANAAQIHALLEGRPALSLSGHSHQLNNFDPGEHYAKWRLADVGPLPFRHIVVGAASGDTWSGDFNLDGDAQSLTVTGEPKGVLMMAFDGPRYVERFAGARLGDRGLWVDFNTPAFRDWSDMLEAWSREPEARRDPVPPVTVNDLADTRVLTPEDLAEGVWATVNFWQGSASATVRASINGGPSFELARTQEGQGEDWRLGAEYLDPFSTKRRATIGRFAYQSRSGDELAQGHGRGQGHIHGLGVVRPPQPYAAMHRPNPHLWRARLPQNLAEGVHRLSVIATDHNGQTWRDVTLFEVRPYRLAPHLPRSYWSRSKRDE